MWKWLKDRAVFIGIAIVAVGALCVAVFRKRASLKSALRQLGDLLTKEKKIIDQKAEIRKIKAKEGHAAAIRKVKQQHQARLLEMKEEERKEVAALENDPEALVERMLRASE